jgi:sugar diacid utilization regulator
VTALPELVESPPLNSVLTYLTRPRATQEVRGVALVEELAELSRTGTGAIVLLTRAASALAGSYRFDVALRIGRSIGISALVLCGPGLPDVTPTAAAIADRAGIAILAAGEDVDLAELAIAIARELAGGADAALMRAHTAMRAALAHPAGAAPEALALHAGSALGRPIALVEGEPSNAPSALVRRFGHGDRWVTAARPADGELALAVDLVLAIVAAATAQALDHAQQIEERPITSRTEVLSELLAVAPEHRDTSAYRARELGIPIDGYHVATRLEFEELANRPDGGDTVEAFAAHQALARAVLGEVSATGGVWHLARSGSASILIRMTPEDPGATASTTVADQIDLVLRHVRTRGSTTLIRCGVGAAHPGVSGLFSSAAEARAATSAARTTRRTQSAVPFDGAGLRRSLVEWYTSYTAQDAMSSVLAPLVELGGARAERLIQTLHVYLDHQGSLTQTAAALNLHRNAVAYRVNQIFALLEVDPDSADDRLLLQLACRAREMAT